MRLPHVLFRDHALPGVGSAVQEQLSQPPELQGPQEQLPGAIFGLPSGSNTHDGAPVGQMSGISTFTETATASVDSVVRIEKDLPLKSMCLLGCGVGAGWGSAVNAAQVAPGDTVIAMGVGGVGSNAVQGEHRPPEGGRDVLTDMFVRDITHGIADSGIRAQNIKVATDVAGVTPNNERILRAAGRAALETGAPITTHTHAADRVGLEQQRILAEEGLDLTNVVIGHSGDSTDLDYLRALMSAGSTIASDRFGLGGAGRATEDERIDTIATLCAEGYAGQIVLSHDCLMVCDWKDSFAAYPATWVPTHVSDVILPALAERGVPEQDLHTMMVSAPARLLSAVASDTAAGSGA
jgi:predicted metal-dependent phosphotriesterase family hydrolase